MLLKRNTAYKRPFSFVGVSLTVLTVQISKDGGAFADLDGAAQPAQITGAFYYVPMAVADTDTLGSIMYKFSDSILGIVLPNEDATDQVMVDLPGGAVSSVTNPVDANLVTWLGGTPQGLAASGFLPANVFRFSGCTPPSRWAGGIIFGGTVSAISGTSLTCGTGADGWSISGTDNAYAGCMLAIANSGIITDLRAVTAFDQATKTFTVDSAFVSVSADRVYVFADRGNTYPSNFSALSISTGGLMKIQSGITKNAAIAGWMFPMYAPTDHENPLTGLTITATRSLDGAAFAACANSATEIGTTGVYKINLAAGDLNGTTVTLRFAATGAETRIIEIVTTP